MRLTIYLQKLKGLHLRIALGIVMRKVINTIKCLIGLHEIEHKAWKKEIGVYTSYHSMHACKHCGKVYSHKSDIC